MTHEEAFADLSFSVDGEITSRLRAGAFTMSPALTGDRPATLEAELADLERRYRGRWREPSDAHDALLPARRLYHSFGIDPSKTRPSSEALLRRILQGKGLYRVNAVVDAANLASLTLLLPVGLYDAGAIRPPVTLRLGLDGEGYEGIRKDRVNVTGRPTLVDADGPFGNPTSDSLRTCVKPATRWVWFFLFAPGDHPEKAFEGDLCRARDILMKHARGE
jgi:DNA/RNA-binding domain of Phe-tRNA-synthetase-like protein